MKLNFDNSTPSGFSGTPQDQKLCLNFFELGHHVINLELVRIHLKHFPDETREKIREVGESFRMPALNSLPNRHEFVQALRSTRIYDGRVYQQQVVQPTLKSLGLAA